MSEGSWIGRTPSGPVIAFPEAGSRKQAELTAFSVYGPNWTKAFSIEWSDHPESEVMLCDFCSSTEVTTEFAVDGEIVRESEGVLGRSVQTMAAEWAACTECMRILEAGDVDALVTRSVEAFVRNNATRIPPDRVEEFSDVIRPEISDLFVEVRRRWNGKSVPLVTKGGE